MKQGRMARSQVMKRWLILSKSAKSEPLRSRKSTKRPTSPTTSWQVTYKLNSISLKSHVCSCCSSIPHFPLCQGLISEFTSINDNSDEFIYNYFAELERKVDLKREELIGEIHRISDKLLAEIGGHKKEIQSQQEKRKKKQSYDREQLRQYQAELDAYNGELKEYSVDLNRWKEVQTETESKREELAIKIRRRSCAAGQCRLRRASGRLIRSSCLGKLL